MKIKDYQDAIEFFRIWSRGGIAEGGRVSLSSGGLAGMLGE